MIPRNHKNSKAYTDLSCPGCGMRLDSRKTDGFVSGNETYCCEGCAEGTGCTCSDVRIVPKKAGQKPGHLGQRNPENNPRDRNYNEEVDTSGNPINNGNRRETAKAPRRYKTRVAHTTEPPKQKRSLTVRRDSQREQARGRSEFTKRAARGTRVDRTSRTGTKSK